LIRMARVRQSFPRPRVDDIAQEVERQLEAAGAGPRLVPGARVAVTAGSRGISGLAEVLQAVARYVRSYGAEPFLVAAMGSHGGGTVAGQREILRHLGVTEESVGAPLLVTEQAVELGTTPDGHRVWCDVEAARANAILVINRVKPHTSFRAPVQSGLLKMLAVGMGKVPGATQVHALGAQEIGPAILSMARLMLARLPVIGGLAIVENGYEETAILAGIPPEAFEQRETELLREAEAMLPRLPVQQLDLLVVDEIGKNLSGTGMDTNVIGRWKVPGLPEPDSPLIRRIVALRLSPASGGNANGIGLADFTTQQLVGSVDWQATYLNVMTSTFLDRAKQPITLPDDRTAVQWALESLRLPEPSAVRAARIRNTLHLEELWLSEAVLPEVSGRVELLSDPRPMQFDGDGCLVG
jgi:uncharacterized protein (DUF362 family)